MRLWDFFTSRDIHMYYHTESALDTTFQYFSRPKTFLRLVFDHRAAVVVLWPFHIPSGVSLWHMCLMNCTRPITIWGNYYYYIRTLAGKNNWRRQCKKTLAKITFAYFHIFIFVSVIDFQSTFCRWIISSSSWSSLDIFAELKRFINSGSCIK